jgi:hypothetical protein
MPDQADLDRELDLLAQHLPDWAARLIRWLRSPSCRIARVTLAILLVLGGVVGFLPILGFWMIPLGLLLLAQDIPFLKRPTSKAIVWGERTWTRWQRRRRDKASDQPG